MDFRAPDTPPLDKISESHMLWAIKTLGLPNQIKARRKALGWTQAQLAERMGAKQGEVSRLERGGCNPNFRTIKRLATAMGLYPCLEFLDYGKVLMRADTYRTNLRQDILETRFPEGLQDVLERVRW